MNRPARIIATTAHRGRDLAARLELRPSWVTVEPNPADAEVLDTIRLFAILVTWMEADIVAATVKNAFAQGAERVYLIDNGSADDTVTEALRAGAVLAANYTTRYHDEPLKNVLMNSVCWKVSSEEKDEHIWWMFLDADEFPQGPGTTTVAEYLGSLDRRFRIVGSTFYNHYPDRKPEYVYGRHPLDVQPLCELYFQPPIPRCRAPHHWKHPLVRFDRDGPFIVVEQGFHQAHAHKSAPLYEPSGGIMTHHFPFRAEATTRRRLEAIFGPGSRGQLRLEAQTTGGLRRLRSLDAVYHQRWSEVDNNQRVKGHRGVTLKPWDEVQPHSQPARWYH